MRVSYLVVAAVTASLLVGCNNNPSTPPTNASEAFASRFLSLTHTPPHPPPQRHRITAAMRARARAGGWQEVASTVSWRDGPNAPMLMTDGTVMVHDYCTSNWYSLAPDQSGSYVDGKWTKKASMPKDYAPIYYASAVLADGKLILNGGEYNGAGCPFSNTTAGAIYDPVKNAWKAVSGPPGWYGIGDGQSVVLPDGTYMIGNCCDKYQALFNEKKLSWIQSGPYNGKRDVNSEEGWALLPDGHVLVVDVTDPPHAQTYSETSNMWTSAGHTPVAVVSGPEIGPETLRPDGTVFVAGATGNTAIYTPNGGRGTWARGPRFPVFNGQQFDVADGPSTLLTDGEVMIPASPGFYQTPAFYFLFDGKKLGIIAGPPNAINDSTYNTGLLMLPTGQVLEVDDTPDIEVYTPKRNGAAATAPDVTSVSKTLKPANTYTITGRHFNGASQSNMFG
ncbi:MAG TPA: hypothetical protein VGI19_08155, partial [Candidatus Cybelea sp.]